MPARSISAPRLMTRSERSFWVSGGFDFARAFRTRLPMIFFARAIGDWSVLPRVIRQIDQQTKLLLELQLENLVGSIRRNRPARAVGGFAYADPFMALVAPRQYEHSAAGVN